MNFQGNMAVNNSFGGVPLTWILYLAEMIPESVPDRYTGDP